MAGLPEGFNEQVLLKYMSQAETNKAVRELATLKAEMERLLVLHEEALKQTARELEKGLESLRQDHQQHRRELASLQQFSQDLGSLQKTQSLFQEATKRLHDESTAAINQLDQRLDDEKQELEAQTAALRSSITQVSQLVEGEQAAWQEWQVGLMQELRERHVDEVQARKRHEEQIAYLSEQQTALREGLDSPPAFTPEMVEFVKELMEMHGPLATVLAAAKMGKDIFSAPGVGREPLVSREFSADWIHPERSPPVSRVRQQHDPLVTLPPRDTHLEATVQNAGPISLAVDVREEKPVKPEPKPVRKRQPGPRSVAFYSHVKKAELRARAKPPSSHRHFIWKFINDIKFKDWREFMEEQLLQSCPQHVFRQSRPGRGNHRIRIAASLTWAHVYAVIRNLKIPNRLEGYVE